MNEDHEDKLTEPKPIHQAASSSLLRTILSLAAFIAVDYLIFKSWAAVFLLVSVILLHESGHFIAMKRFGYQGVNMTFVPFMGAYVSGQATHFSKVKKLIVLLAGPLPGIIIGMALLVLYQYSQEEFYYLAALAFLLLNVFNLLPVSPLDGGQLVETIFFSGNYLIQIIFLLISLAIVFYLLYQFRSWFLIIIAWFLLIRIRSLTLTYRVRKELNRKHIPYDCSYDDLTDEHYTLIRDIIVTQSSFLRRRFSPGEYSIRESELISYVEKVLMPSYHHPLSRDEKFIFMGVYILAIVLPIFHWFLVKGWL
jgi:Zn-dependent protease